MVFAATVVPKAVVMVEGDLVLRNHAIGEVVQIIREALADASGREASDVHAIIFGFTGPHVAAPPVDWFNVADEQFSIANEPAVGDGNSMECHRQLGWRIGNALDLRGIARVTRNRITVCGVGDEIRELRRRFG